MGCAATQGATLETATVVSATVSSALLPALDYISQQLCACTIHKGASGQSRCYNALVVDVTTAHTDVELHILRMEALSVNTLDCSPAKKRV